MRGLLSAAVMALATTTADASPEILRCTPALKTFCANIHVGCAGRSRIATTGFVVAFLPDTTPITFDGGAEWVVDLREDDRQAVLRRRGSRDWISIDKQTGRYAQRIYRGGKALMTRGSCERTLE